jgi:hypothetical protein
MDQNQTQTWSVSWYVKAIYQISNEYLKTRTKKCGKLRICDIFLSPRVITSCKINGSTPNSILICILICQSNIPNIKWISENTNKKKKMRKTENSWYFSKSKGHNFMKNQIQTWSVSWYGKAMYQISNEYRKAWTKKCGKLIYRLTDRQTDGRSANLKSPSTSSVGD